MNSDITAFKLDFTSFIIFIVIEVRAKTLKITRPYQYHRVRQINFYLNFTSYQIFFRKAEI